MKLAAWMKSKDLDDAGFAKLLGDVSEHAVKKWRYGERQPRHEQMRRIVEVTDGAVTPNDLFSTKVAA